MRHVEQCLNVGSQRGYRGVLGFQTNPLHPRAGHLLVQLLEIFRHQRLALFRAQKLVLVRLQLDLAVDQFALQLLRLVGQKRSG